MELCSISSGSSGNCIFVGDDSSSILIDAGISGKRIEAGLNEIDHTGRDISAILITHEHSDHIGGLGVMARRYGIPIYTTKGTAEAILSNKYLGKIPDGLINIISEDIDFTVGDLRIHPIRVSHDAASPVAYRVHDGDKSICVMTDLGFYDDYIIENLRNVDALLLESNHDVRMLEMGPYPYILKQRILGNRGHLSNENAGRLLSTVLHDNIKKILLGHLSQENNMAELAYETVRLEVEMGSNPYHASDFEIAIAPRDRISDLIRV